MKKKLWITICFIFALCGMVLMTVPTQAKTSKNSNDVKYLKALIKEQKKQGATVSSDINNKKQYEWSKSGRIKCIYWRNKKLKGVIDISRFEGLKDFYCNKNKITELKLNKTLMNLDCSDNEISFLDASKCVLDYSLTCNRNKIKKNGSYKNKNLYKRQTQDYITTYKKSQNKSNYNKTTTTPT